MKFQYSIKLRSIFTARPILRNSSVISVKECANRAHVTGTLLYFVPYTLNHHITPLSLNGNRCKVSPRLFRGPICPTRCRGILCFNRHPVSRTLHPAYFIYPTSCNFFSYASFLFASRRRMCKQFYLNRLLTFYLNFMLIYTRSATPYAYPSHDLLSKNISNIKGGTRRARAQRVLFSHFLSFSG